MSKKQFKILRYIRKYKCLYKILKKLGYTLDDYIEFQENFPDGSNHYMIFSDFNFDENTTVSLTVNADALLDSENRERRRILISVLSLIIAIFAFIQAFFF